MEYEGPDSLFTKISSKSFITMSKSLFSPGWLEIRLFYVRIFPCVVRSVPDHLNLCHLRRESGFSLEINGHRVPQSETASLTLRRDRLNKESSEVTYVSTDAVHVTGATEFEVYEKDDLLLLCGNLDRMEGAWSRIDSRTGWEMDCCIAKRANESRSGSAFFQRKLRVSSPSIEVYVAGCCGGMPVILTKTIQVSPRKKGLRHVTLETIPEDEELGKDHPSVVGTASIALFQQQKLQIIKMEGDESETDRKILNDFHPEGKHTGGENGEPSLFNSGVRVGVGIGLSVCIGIGIGVGLLLHSYQATTKNVKRRWSFI